MPSEDFLSIDLIKLTEMDEEEYQKLFRGSAVKRTKFAGLKRNVNAISKNRNK
jgi:epoxyqueuosine reductase